MQHDRVSPEREEELPVVRGRNSSVSAGELEGMNLSSACGREAVMLSFGREATNICASVGQTLPKSNQLLGLHVGARWRPR